MKTLLATLATLGLVKSADASEADAVSQVNAAHAALQGQISTAQLAAKSADDATKAVQAKLDDANKTIVEARKKQAETIVQAAVKAGRIAPQDTAVQARWQSLIETDPANADLLASLPVKPLDKRETKPGVGQESAVQAKAGDGSVELRGVDRVTAALQRQRDASNAA